MILLIRHHCTQSTYEKQKESSYKKKVVRIQIGKEKLRNLILDLLSHVNMGLRPIIKIVHHTHLENIEVLFLMSS